MKKHFYTISTAELEVAKGAGFRVEGVEFHAMEAPGPGLTPVYRLLNRKTADNFYTPSETESRFAAEKLGYTLKGPAFYVPTR